MVTDVAHNESRKTALVTVDFFSSFQNIPPFNPPQSPLPLALSEVEGLGAPFGDDKGVQGTGAPFGDDKGASPAPTQGGSSTNPFANSEGAVGSALSSTASSSSNASTGSGFANVNNLLGPLGLIAAGTLAYQFYRREEDEAQQTSSGGILASSVRFDPPPPVNPILPPTPPIDDEDDDKKDVVVTSTPSPYVPIPAGVPIAPGTPLIQRNPPLPLTQEQFDKGLDVSVDSSNATVDYGSLPRLGLEVPVNSSWVESKVIRSAQGLFAPVQEVVDDLNLWAVGKTPLGQVALNAADNTFNRTSIATAMTSIAGNAMSLMGIQQGQTVADVGTVSGAVVDAGAMVTGTIKLIQTLTSGAAVPAVGVLAKVGGALAIPLGAIVAYIEIGNVRDDYADDGELSQDGKASAWNAAGGLLTTVGGIFMFVPGVGPIVGGILLAAGGVCSGVSWCIQNQDKITAFGNKLENSINTTTANLKNTVTQAVNTAQNAVAETVKKVTETAAKTITKVTETVKNTVKVVTDVAKNIVKAVTDAPKNIAKAVIDAPKNIVKVVTNTVKAVTNTVKVVTQTAKNTVKSIGNAISKWFKPKP